MTYYSYFLFIAIMACFPLLFLAGLLMMTLPVESDAESTEPVASVTPVTPAPAILPEEVA